MNLVLGWRGCPGIRFGRRAGLPLSTHTPDPPGKPGAGCDGMEPETDLSASQELLGVKYAWISANFGQSKESGHRYGDPETDRDFARIFGVHPRIRIVAFKVSRIRRTISVDRRDRRFKWTTTQIDRNLEMQRMAARPCPGMRTRFQPRVACTEGRARLPIGKELGQKCSDRSTNHAANVGVWPADRDLDWSPGVWMDTLRCCGY